MHKVTKVTKIIPNKKMYCFCQIFFEILRCYVTLFVKKYAQNNPNFKNFRASPENLAKKWQKWLLSLFCFCLSEMHKVIQVTSPPTLHNVLLPASPRRLWRRWRRRSKRSETHGFRRRRGLWQRSIEHPQVLKFRTSSSAEIQQFIITILSSL